MPPASGPLPRPRSAPTPGSGGPGTNGQTPPTPSYGTNTSLPGFGPSQLPANDTIPVNDLINQFGVANTAQGANLQNQYTNALAYGQGILTNDTDYRNAQAANDLARLGLQEGRDVGLGKERNAADTGFANRAFGIDSRGNALQRDMRYRANDSEAAGRGSITSFGYGQNERDILGQFGIAQDTTQLTFDKKLSDLALDDKALDSLGQEFGIRRSDVQNALKYGITQLGLDWVQTQATLAANLASGDAQLAQNARNFMVQVMGLPMEAPSLGDIFPGGLPTGQAPMTGGTGPTNRNPQLPSGTLDDFGRPIGQVVTPGNPNAY